MEKDSKYTAKRKELFKVLEEKEKRHNQQEVTCRRVTNNIKDLMSPNISEDLNRRFCLNFERPSYTDGDSTSFFYKGYPHSSYDNLKSSDVLEKFAEKADPLCNAIYAFLLTKERYLRDIDKYFKTSLHDSDEQTLIHKILNRSLTEREYYGMLNGEIPFARIGKGKDKSHVYLPKGFGEKFLDFTEKYDPADIDENRGVGTTCLPLSSALGLLSILDSGFGSDQISDE